jgi:hypothetical protein
LAASGGSRVLVSELYLQKFGSEQWLG